MRLGAQDYRHRQDEAQIGLKFGRKCSAIKQTGSKSKWKPAQTTAFDVSVFVFCNPKLLARINDVLVRDERQIADIYLTTLTMKMVAGDTFLPVLKVPKAIFQGTVRF